MARARVARSTEQGSSTRTDPPVEPAFECRSWSAVDEPSSSSVSIESDRVDDGEDAELLEERSPMDVATEDKVDRRAALAEEELEEPAASLTEQLEEPADESAEFEAGLDGSGRGVTRFRLWCAVDWPSGGRTCNLTSGRLPW
mmetsp:Transcript_328/g.733  ORF Transcript_328/g.733 Transcript_328/m.733 type:complete len:143 (-) Transcript_328:582-1010(-)